MAVFHISCGTCIILVVAGITYGIILALRDLFHHATPVVPRNYSNTSTDWINDHVIAKAILSGTIENKTFPEDSFHTDLNEQTERINLTVVEPSKWILKSDIVYL